MKKIVVTGGAGFIGSHTVAELVRNGYHPVIIDDFSNSDERVLGGLEAIIGQKPLVYRFNCCDDRRLREVFDTHKPDGVIHFAAFKAVGESVEEPLRYYRNNLVSLITLLEVMTEKECRHLVFSSSCTVYGQPEQNPVTEQTPRLPANSPYGRSKQMGEDIITDFCKANPEFRAVMLRYFNPVGAHPSGLIGELPFGVPNNLIPFLTQAAAGLRDRLTVFGSDYSTPDGSCIRDFIHVVDLAAAHVSAIRRMESGSDSCEIYNLGQGRGNSVLEVIRTFEEVTGVPVPHEIGPRRPGDVEQIWADVSLATRELGWKTELTLSDALRDAWRWQQCLGASGIS
jgi:UDP-glucose 4-epimerase